MFYKDTENHLECEEFFFLSEGLRLRTYLCKPKIQQKYPLVIVNHGGGGMSPTYEHLCRYLALQNIVAAVMTYRGFYPSEGKQMYGHGEAQDIINLINELISRDYVDSTRIGVLGISRGGHHALMVSAEIPLSAVAVWSAPTNLFELYDIHPFMLRDIIGGSPANLENEYYKRSPVYFVENMKAPLLVIHGKNDEVVPVSHALNLDREFKRLNKDCKLSILDNEEHNFSVEGFYQAWAMTIEFFKENLSEPSINLHKE